LSSIRWQFGPDWPKWGLNITDVVANMVHAKGMRSMAATSKFLPSVAEHETLFLQVCVIAISCFMHPLVLTDFADIEISFSAAKPAMDWHLPGFVICFLSLLRNVNGFETDLSESASLILVQDAMDVVYTYGAVNAVEARTAVNKLRGITPPA
jgi:hypothetical protein